MKNTLIILTLISFISCSVQKRKYRDGYTLSWLHKKHDNQDINRNKKVNFAKKISKPANINKQVTEPLIKEVTSKALVKTESEQQKRKSFAKVAVSDSCDKIIFKDGTEVKARILEISPTKIKYKRCDLPNGPDYVVESSLVSTLIYSNGTVETIKRPDIKQDLQKGLNTAYTGKPVANDKATASLITGILMLIIGLGIIPIVLGNMALSEIDAQPGRYNNRNMAVIGKTLGWVKLIIVGLYILAVIAVFALYFI
jgi:hypothetical protein